MQCLWAQENAGEPGRFCQTMRLALTITGKKRRTSVWQSINSPDKLAPSFKVWIEKNLSRTHQETKHPQPRPPARVLFREATKATT